MATVFNIDFERIKKEVFWNQDIKDLSSELFKT